VIARFVDIGGIVDHHCFNKTKHLLSMNLAGQESRRATWLTNVS
jgi:hypothetical protein